MVRQLISADVELGVGERLLLKHQDHGVWRLLRLVLYQLVDALVVWIVRLCRVPLNQHLLALGIAQQRQAADCCGIGGFRQPLKQAAPVTHPALHRR